VFKWFSTVHNFRVADLHITVGMKMDCNDFSTIEGDGYQIEMVKRIKLIENIERVSNSRYRYTVSLRTLKT
jgi:hypothetical protein